MLHSNNSSLHPTAIRLICLPFSGGSSYAFQPLAEYWPATWKVTTLAYPGRGQRIREPLLHTMKDLIEDSRQQIRGNLQEPYALLGHSLGGTLAYLLAHRIIEEGGPPPQHLFLSGTDGPSVPPETPHRYLLSKGDLKEKLVSYGGISEEILNDADAFDFFEPIIRADFQVVETWQYSEKPKLNIPATVITGTDEDMTEADIRLWRREFSTEVTFKKMSGNHFFLFEHARQFAALLQDTLSKNTEHIGHSAYWPEAKKN